MRFYLAGRYSRREELAGYRDQLHSIGHVVVARWLDGHHEIFGDKTAMDLQEARDNLREVKRQQFAMEDLEDLLGAEGVIAFTEEPRQTRTRGGRHVEFGVAIALAKHTIVVGPKENVFYSLPSVHHFNSWREFLEQELKA